jgi:hypothetical protein
MESMKPLGRNMLRRGRVQRLNRHQIVCKPVDDQERIHLPREFHGVIPRQGPWLRECLA